MVMATEDLAAHGHPLQPGLSGCCKLFCVAAHSRFRERNGACFIGLRLLLQKFPAQERKFLNSNSIAWDQRQIHFDRTVNPIGIDSALKGVGPNTSGLRKSREKELGLPAFLWRRRVVDHIVPPISSPNRRLHTGAYSKISRSCLARLSPTLQSSNTNPVGSLCRSAE